MTGEPRGFEFRHSGRGEPHPLPPDEHDIVEGLERARRVHQATERERRPSWWRRALAGRLLHR